MKTRSHFETTAAAPAISLIDRLQPESNILDVKTALLRDLSNLFNTKLPRRDLSNYPEVMTSIITYGLPNFAEYDANTQGISEQIKTEVQELIARHEPRLRQVYVTVNRVEKNSINFSIEATLLNDPDPISIKFDSKYQPDLQEFKIKERSDG